MLCFKFGGLENLIKSEEFQFAFENWEALTEIMQEYQYFESAMQHVYENFLSENPNYDLKTVKNRLRKEKVKIPRKATEAQIRMLAFKHFKSENIKSLKSQIGCDD